MAGPSAAVAGTGPVGALVVFQAVGGVLVPEHSMSEPFHGLLAGRQIRPANRFPYLDVCWISG
jgi:hypothetical protein